MQALQAIQTHQPTPQQRDFQHFITALGYAENDDVFIRLLPPKGFEAEHYSLFPALTYRKGETVLPKRMKLRMKGDRLFWLTSKGEKFQSHNAFDWLTKANRDGMAPYVIVNPGGHSESQITGSRVIFWEDDKSSKAEQLERFDQYQEDWGGGLAIETRSSIHCYFRHDELHDPLTFSINQLRVIRELGSDESIWDAPRLMRIPGFAHTRIADGAIARTPVKVVRAWDGEITKWAWIDRALPQATAEDIAKATGTHQRSHDSIPLGDEPCDPRNFIKLLPCYCSGSEWDSAQIPASGVTSQNGFKVNLSTGRYKVWSGTVSSWEALKAIAAYLEPIDNRITLQGILDWLRGDDAAQEEDQEISRDEWKGRGFGAVNGGKAGSEELSPAEQRDRMIARRKFKFEQHISTLKNDFELTEAKKRKPEDFEGFCPTFDPKATDTTLIRGWLASGKTEAAIRSILPLAVDHKIVWIPPLNGLARQTATRLQRIAREMGLNVSICHYQDNVREHRDALKSEEPGIFLMCPESLKPYSTGEMFWGNTVVVVDEFSGIRKEVQKRSASFPEFERMLRGCGHLVAADAFLSNADCRIISRYRKGDRLILRQSFKKSPKRIQWAECRTKDGLISMNHDGVALGLLDRWVDEGLKVAIATDSITSAKMIELHLKQKAKREERQINTLLICSERPEENHKFLPDPDDMLEGREVQVCIISPTLRSGGDIQTQFDRGLLLSCGVLSPTQLLQIMGRFRQCHDWVVSAPRRTENSVISFTDLEGDRIKNWTDGLAQSFKSLELEIVSEAHSWAVWDSACSEIEKAFPAEYLQYLLGEYFEGVEVVEFDCRKAEWDLLRDLVKLEDAAKTLSADLERGTELLESNKQPHLNSEVWDVKLADSIAKYPVYVIELIKRRKASQNQEESDLCLKEMILLTARRMERLKWFVIATEGSEADLDEILQGMKDGFTCAVSGRFKAYLNLRLFRELDLGKLARLHKGQKAIAHATHFNAESPEMVERWETFKTSSLAGLYPQVQSLHGFMAIVRQCMSFLGHKGDGKVIRVNTEDLHANGRDRKGNQRYSKSKPTYFAGWFVMVESGSALFCELFPKLLDCLRQRIESETVKFKKKQSPSAEPIAA